MAACRLLCDPDGGPRDLLAEARHPLDKPEPAADDVTERGAALVMSELARVLVRADMAKAGDAA